MAVNAMRNIHSDPLHINIVILRKYKIVHGVAGNQLPPLRSKNTIASPKGHLQNGLLKQFIIIQSAIIHKS